MRPYKESDIFETKQDYLNRLTNKEDNILVSDIDETIVNISPKAYRTLVEKRDIFEEFLDFSTIYTPDQVLQRDTFGLDVWLLKDKKKPLPEELQKKFYEIFDDENFYDDLNLTLFGESLKDFSKLSNMKAIYLVSHCVGEKQINSKLKLLKRVYSNFIDEGKIFFQPLDMSIKKSDFMKEIEWTSFADDHLGVIEDVITNSISFGKELLIPRLGYNSETEKFMRMCDSLNIHYHYFTYH